MNGRLAPAEAFDASVLIARATRVLTAAVGEGHNSIE